MAQDEKAQFAAIKTMMVNGEFDKALVQLEAIGGPKAEEWIAEIKARSPLKSSLPPMPADDLTQAQRLIEQRRFEEAEALIKASEHESAANLMKKLVAARHAEQDARAAGVSVPVPTSAPVIESSLRDRLTSPLALGAMGAGAVLIILFVANLLGQR